MKDLLKTENSIEKSKPTKSELVNLSKKEIKESIKVEFLKDTKNFIGDTIISGKIGEIKDIPYSAYLVLVKNKKVRKV
ncbi:MAG: hypothetical protein WC346_01200 [Methanogenium sp.]|jgi:hypothetical protein